MLSGFRRQGQVPLPVRQVHCRELLQLRGHLRRRMSRHVHRLHASSTRCVRRLIPPVATLLAHPRCVRGPPARLGEYPCLTAEERHRAIARQRYQGTDDVYVILIFRQSAYMTDMH